MVVAIIIFRILGADNLETTPYITHDGEKKDLGQEPGFCRVQVNPGKIFLGLLFQIAETSPRYFFYF